MKQIERWTKAIRRMNLPEHEIKHGDTVLITHGPLSGTVATVRDSHFIWSQRPKLRYRVKGMKHTWFDRNMLMLLPRPKRKQSAAQQTEVQP